MAPRAPPGTGLAARGRGGERVGLVGVEDVKRRARPVEPSEERRPRRCRYTIRLQQPAGAALEFDDVGAHESVDSFPPVTCTSAPVVKLPSLEARRT